MRFLKFFKTTLWLVPFLFTAQLNAAESTNTTEQIDVIPMENAKFSKGWEDIKDLINIASFDQSKPRVIGSPTAPLTLYDVSSLSCGHCAAFHIDTYPKLKADYVDTGKLRIVDLGVVFDQLSFYVKGTTFATKSNAQYEGYLNLIYQNQQKWYSNNYQEEIDNMLKLAFIGADNVKATLENPETGKTLARISEYATTVLDVKSTPTFILTKTGLSPEQELHRTVGNQPDDLIAAIEKALK